MSNSPHILVVDDELHVLRALRSILSANHYRVSVAQTGEDCLVAAVASPPDVIILDLGLPDMDGVQVIERLREWSQTPIIVLSARDDQHQKAVALDKGADDYLTKPFGIEELLARVRVALRHQAAKLPNQSALVNSQDLVIDLANHTVLRNHEPVRLTATEFKLLAYLARNADRICTHRGILVAVWGDAYADQVEYLRVYMRQLRNKLEADPHNPTVLVNEPGIGYRFIRS